MDYIKLLSFCTTTQRKRPPIGDEAAHNLNLVRQPISVCSMKILHGLVIFCLFVKKKVL